MNQSLSNFSEQSTDANYCKINKHGIVKNWIQERYNKFEVKQDDLMKRHVADQIKKKQELNNKTFLLKKDEVTSVFA